jgi:hypothetical protein
MATVCGVLLASVSWLMQHAQDHPHELEGTLQVGQFSPFLHTSASTWFHTILSPTDMMVDALKKPMYV